MQNLQCSPAIPDSGQAAALGGLTVDQGRGVQQGTKSLEGGPVVPDLTSNPLLEFVKGLGWQGMQIPTQSMVVNTVTTPAPQLPLISNPLTALSMPPLPAQRNAVPSQSFAPQAPPQIQLAPPMQVIAPAPGGQLSIVPIPQRPVVPGPAPPILDGVIRPVAQGQMPIQLNAVQMSPAPPQIPQQPRPQPQPQFTQRPLMRQQVNQQSMQAALQQAWQNANVRPQLHQPRPQVNHQQQIAPAQLVAQPIPNQFEQQQVPQQQIAQLPMLQPQARLPFNQQQLQYPIPPSKIIRCGTNNIKS